MLISPIKTQKITEHVYAVRTLISNFYIYTDGGETVCFDTGYMPFIIGAALKKLGIKAESVSNIFLTHSDYDHVGGINTFKNSKIYISKEEEAMITFKRPRLLILFNKSIKREYETLKDGEEKMVGQIKVKAIATPGHTPGSMSYLVNDRILFSGDTLRIQNGKIKPFFCLQNMSTKQDKLSVKKLLKIKGIELICTGHSGFLDFRQ